MSYSPFFVPFFWTFSFQMAQQSSQRSRSPSLCRREREGGFFLFTISAPRRKEGGKKGWPSEEFQQLKGEEVFFFPKESDLQSTVLRITFFLAGIFTFYICYLAIIPKVFRPEKIYTVILSFFLSILCFATLRYLMEGVLLPATFGFRNYKNGSYI